ncbi:MAG: type II toxin-antitoxin system prevent-host-death family antitoxin [Chloroflexi bacterium]|nr:type II toxin-antitoxin system prevent-host-death family antitoxin [Chloroflexota bacterium]
MKTVSIDEIKRNLAGYLERVKTGETLVILEDGDPVAEIKPIVQHGEALRPYALCAGEFQVPEDCDAPLPDDIIDQFEDR